MPLLDEVCAAVEVLNGAEFQLDVALGAATLAALVLALPQALGLLVEARLLLLVGRFGRGRAIGWSMAGVAGALALGAAFPPLLPVALLLASPLQGLMCGAAQAGVVAAHPGEPDRAMARWSAFAAAGDLLGPLLCAAVAALGGGWRAAFLVAAGWLVAQALAARRGPELAAVEEDEEAPEDLRGLLRAAARDRRLVLALLAATSCSLLDEVLVLFGALWLESRGVPAPERGLAFAAFAGGLVLGAALVEPLLRRLPARRLLALASLGCGLAYAAWLVSPTALLLGLVGLLNAPLYPLAEARAYALAPPDRVAALSRVVGVVEVLVPLAVGLVAERVGLRAALAVLLLEPVVLLWVALTDGWRHRRSTADM